jgi:hypothetical protein
MMRPFLTTKALPVFFGMIVSLLAMLPPVV